VRNHSPRFGDLPRIVETREITEARERLPAQPPPDRDLWPWLLLLAVAATAGLVVWLVVLNRHPAHGTVVPGVVGLRQQQAIKRLTGAGFDVRAVVGPASAPRGVVASQSPPAGSKHDKGSTVTLAVSSGKHVQTVTTKVGTTTATSTTTPVTQAQVPDVTGKDAATGAGTLEAAGFVAETEPVTASGPAGSIIEEAPPAGTSAKAGSVVRLSVAVGSTRPAKQVPSVTGAKAAAARASLLDAGLTVRTQYRHAPAAERGVVLSQSPSAGGSAPAYTQVTIVVGSSA
jgi:eukaryotic-like serine/threonine-protein kinase